MASEMSSLCAGDDGAGGNLPGLASGFSGAVVVEARGRVLVGSALSASMSMGALGLAGSSSELLSVSLASSGVCSSSELLVSS